MNDDHLMLLGSIKAHLEHIQKTTDTTAEKLDALHDRVDTLETWRTGLVIASGAIVTILAGLGASVKSVFAAITHH